MRQLSFRHVIWSGNLSTVGYALVDYSDWVLLRNENEIKKLEEWEKDNLANATLLYNKDYIKVYKLGTD